MKKIRGRWLLVLLLFVALCAASFAGEGNFTAEIETGDAPISPQNVLDAENSLPDRVFVPKWYPEFLWGASLFVAGFVAGRLWLRRSRRRRKRVRKPHPLIERIEETKHPKTLLRLLIACDDARLDPYIARLETALYEEGSIDLERIKSQLKKALLNAS